MSHLGHHHFAADRLLKDGVELGLAGYALHNAAIGQRPSSLPGQAADFGGRLVIVSFVFHFVIVPWLAASAIVMGLPAILYELLVPLRACDSASGVCDSATPMFDLLLVLGLIGWIGLQVWWWLRLKRPKENSPRNWIWAAPYLIVTGVLVNLPTLVWALVVRHTLGADGNPAQPPAGFWVLAVILLLVWLACPVRWAFRRRVFALGRPDQGIREGPQLQAPRPDLPYIQVRNAMWRED